MNSSIKQGTKTKINKIGDRVTHFELEYMKIEVVFSGLVVLGVGVGGRRWLGVVKVG